MLKRWNTKVNFSTNTSTTMEGSKNSRNAPITTLEMEETQELRDHVVANLAISSISWVLMARISRIPPFGTFFYLQDVRWGVVFGHPPFGAFFSAFPKGVLGVFYGSGIPIDPRTIGCIEGFLWFYSHLQFCFKGLARKTNAQHLECICFPLEFLRWLVAETHLVLPSHSKTAIGLYLVGVYPRIFLESVKGFGH